MNTSNQIAGLREKVMAGLNPAQPPSFGFRMMPMIDMLFLLLIFFLLTANFRPLESYLPFQLPSASAGSSAFGRAEPLAIVLTSVPNGCRVRVAQTKTLSIAADYMDQNFTALARHIAEVSKQQKRSAADPVELICDKNVQWQYVAKLYNILFGMGVEDITFHLNE